jgi:hypothetical protein
MLVSMATTAIRQRRQSILAWRRRVNPHALSKDNGAAPIAYFMNLFPNLMKTLVYGELDAAQVLEHVVEPRRLLRELAHRILPGRLSEVRRAKATSAANLTTRMQKRDRTSHQPITAAC